MGHVLLADLPEEELDAFLAAGPLEHFTEGTITDPDRLRTRVAEVRRRGWALVDQELETGLRSIAAPVRGGNGRVVAALNLAAAAPRVGVAQLRDQFLPALLGTTEQVSVALARQAGVDSRRSAPRPLR